MADRPRRLRASFLAATSAFTLLLPYLPARADDDGAANAPDPGVARVSVVQGDVDIQRADSGDSYAAAVNAPLSAGDYVTTHEDAYGEIEFDHGTAIRIAPGTQLRFTQLAVDKHELQLAAGTVDLRLFRGLGAHPAVQTPGATIVPDGDGSVRITVTDDGTTEVTSRIGSADVQTTNGTQTLDAGSTLLVVGNAGDARFQNADTIAEDGFDTFNRKRDAYAERSNDWAYVDAGIVGADDLDSYGEWSDVPGYGRAWQPADEPDGWAPYHTGQWVWQPYYGWSWVDTAPWGYAPYHYGRWFYANDAWYWSPGVAVEGPIGYAAPVAYVPQPVVYRPALVAFFSFGGGGGFGGGFGNVGWCALAPSEPFHPWYGRGGGNVTYETTTVTNVTNIYRNARVPGAAVAVDNASFASGNFSHPVPIRRDELAHAAPVAGVVPVVPTRSNLAYRAGAPEPVTPSQHVDERFTPFAGRPATPVTPFAEQQRVVRSAAADAYPEHAELIAHPHVGPAMPRPVPPEREAPEERSATPFDRFDHPNVPRAEPEQARPVDGAPNVRRLPAPAPAPYRAPSRARAPRTHPKPKPPAEHG